MTGAIVAGRRTWLGWIIDHNPCFIFSGLCMLFGCHLLNIALYTPAGDTHKLLWLLTVLNVYETLLVLLGVVLVRKEVFVRDGRILLGAEAMFLCDITFTSGVIGTIDPRWGFAVAGTLLAIAGVKFAIILKMLRAPMRWRTWLFFILQLACVLGVAAVFKLISHPRFGKLPETVVYAGWWVAGLLPVVGLLIRGNAWRRAEPCAEAGLVRLFVVLPFISLLVHLYSGGWVYSVPFRAVFVAPALLGMAAGASAGLRWAMTRRTLTWLQLGACAMALWLAARPVSAILHWRLFGRGFGPWELTLLASVLTVFYAAWLRRDWQVALTAALAGVVVWTWKHLDLIFTWIHDLVAWIIRGLVTLWDLLISLIPSTTGQWGVAAVVAAFALLGIGYWMSIRRESPESDGC